MVSKAPSRDHPLRPFSWTTRRMTDDESVRLRDPGEEELPRMGFFDHLEEFRKRLIVCLIAVFVAFLLCWNWAPEIFEFLAKPVRKVLPPGQNLSYTTLTEPFLMYFRVALFAGAILASP